MYWHKSLLGHDGHGPFGAIGAPKYPQQPRIDSAINFTLLKIVVGKTLDPASRFASLKGLQPPFSFF
jgi:hypothetical protein